MKPGLAAAGWSRFWFTPAPPHLYALLRIAFGVIGLIHLAAMSDIAAYWAPDGILPTGSHEALSAWLLSAGYGDAFGAGLWLATGACYVAMALGWKTNVAVTAGFAASLLQGRWNPLPLSAALQLFQNVLFCLVWADCGRAWSVDAWRSGSSPEKSAPIWPLRLIRVQVALLYFTSALWKLGEPIWRSGATLHYVLGGTVNTRFPGGTPLALEPYLPAMAYAVLLWEFSFPLLLLNHRTRTFTLVSGIFIHLSMWFFLELGPFTLVVLAAYLAFIDPVRFASWARARGRPTSS